MRTGVALAAHTAAWRSRCAGPLRDAWGTVSRWADACASAFRSEPPPSAISFSPETLEPAIERSFAEQLGALLPAISDELAAVEAPQAQAPESIVVKAPPVPVVARVVPLTRLPLRRHAQAIVWPTIVGQTFSSRAERLAFLRRPEARQRLDEALVAAYREEDADGRLLALRALCAVDAPGKHAALVDALSAGTDEERAFAVDALIECGECADLVPALRDRVDAIAAAAALGYVGSTTRGDYVRMLEAHLDPPRIDAMLALLGGIVA